MTAPDNITLCLSILSFILAAISVITVIITIRQNKYILESAARPYITLYTSLENGAILHLILHNFGESGGRITAFSCDVDLSKSIFDVPKFPGTCTPFEHIVGYTLAPHQSIRAPVEFHKLMGLNKQPKFEIEYAFGKKKYSESVTINLRAHTDYVIANLTHKD